VNDYIPITTVAGQKVGIHREATLAGPEPEARLSLGEWWKQPPHAIRPASYAPYRGEGVAATMVTAEALVPGGKREVRYAPTSQKRLLEAFLEVAQKRATPQSFADRFGLLGYNHLVPEENKCREGDPISWFMAHAQTVHVLAVLTSLIKDRRRLAAYLANEIPLGPYALAGQVVDCPSFRLRLQNPVIPALGIIRYLVNANLGSTGYRLRLTAHGLDNFFSFRALIQVVYWQLADLFGGHFICRCRECGRVFVSRNSRTQFCLAEGKKTISPCKSRWNTRNTRRRQKRSRR